MYDYKCMLFKVEDGDTQHLEVDQGLDTLKRPFKARLLGLDCDKKNTPGGKAAIEFVRAWYESARHMGDIICYTTQDKTEKYGRYLATIVNAHGESLNAALIKAELALPWDGHGPRPAETAGIDVPHSISL
jgi:endonuclease YncB( thermonuclease family)